MSRWTLGLMLFCLQMGCASTVIDSPQSQAVGHYDILSTPLDYQHHVVYAQGDRHRLCHSTPRDALVGSSESIGLSGAGESVSASDGVTSTMASGRSDVTYISTEIMYRVCEFILNSNLSQEDATALFLIALEQVADIGVAALISNTEGFYNTASGLDALVSNTTGARNTASGANALISNTEGDGNTAVGYNANVASGNLQNATAIGANATVNASNTIQLGNSAW